METKKQYSWWAEDDSCYEKYDSIDEAIADAQEMYNAGTDAFMDGETYPVINVGRVIEFDLKDATKQIVEEIEDTMWEILNDFCFGYDFDHEVTVLEKDKEKFIKEATEALFPIIEKYMFINPQWVCTCDIEYDLSERKIVEQ